jgi:hypothetical protein
MCASAGCDEQLLQEEKDRRKGGGGGGGIGFLHSIISSYFWREKSTGSKSTSDDPSLGCTVLNF